MGTADRRVGGALPFSSALQARRRQQRVPLIVDIKPVSPRDGDLLKRREPAELARLAEQAGAAAVSVVTERSHFGGSIAMLRDVAQGCSVPVLQKDFFATTAQLAESRAAGAAAILIILANTSDAAAAGLHREARKLGLEAVVEIHNREELERALLLKPTIIGINNRDILRLETDAGDVSVTEALAPQVPAEILIISESSLRSRADIRRAIAAGADAVLIGTAVLQAPDPCARIADLTAPERGANFAGCK